MQGILPLCYSGSLFAHIQIFLSLKRGSRQSLESDLGKTCHKKGALRGVSNFVRPKIYPADKHGISPEMIDSDALRIITTLHQAGFIAYLVGGGVRDLLARIKPKDFDISTSAKPEEIKKIFGRNCLLIGRRFRLAHLRFGEKVFEVSTFRSGDSEDSDLIVRDNRWGTPEEDVLRRDFTMNGLFYDPDKGQIIDYVGGCHDTESGLLRVIGDPDLRFKQDPVRMIRLLKFWARFNFRVDEPALKSLKEHKEEILKSSPARVLEEMFKMLESGASEPFFHLLTQFGIMELLFPPIAFFLEGDHREDALALLRMADKLVKELHRTPKRSVLMACLVYPILHKEIEVRYLKNGHKPHLGEIIVLASDIIHGVLETSFCSIPRKIRVDLQELLVLQYRMTPVNDVPPRLNRLSRHICFQEAAELLELRAGVQPHLRPIFESLDIDLDTQTKPPPVKKRRSRPRRVQEGSR